MTGLEGEDDVDLLAWSPERYFIFLQPLDPDKPNVNPTEKFVIHGTHFGAP